ncbi:NAD(P)/FAD-dependent oxidoreductase [Halorussus litoreus]|uniref:NAD(P)/FAD-dependent oxidoreductase n=1 Tax=Halorussus litoreus TaxID=1710536 RepID=UPI000E242206|nr:FAD-dependent oxidoreductase [Halorussus litoreus]
MSRIAIVGGGVAGLATAYALRGTDAEVTVFERRESVGGRAATRSRAECVYDTGANYAKGAKDSDGQDGDESDGRVTDDRVSELLSGELADGLVDIEEPVWTFDADGNLSEGRDDDSPKWTYQEGLVALAAQLREASDATVRTRTEVVGIDRREARNGDREDDEWRVDVRGGETVADALVFTPPAPVTAYLLDRSAWDAPLCDDLREAAAAVPYRTLLSVALHYPYREALPYYALVNSDKDHDIGWIGREECKPGHVPDGESLLVVQPSPDWSREHYDDPDDQIAVNAADRTAELLGDPDRYQFDWAEVVRWRDALPDAGADREVLARGADADLFFAGDWVVGEGRVHAALRSGLETGERVAEWL